MDKVLVDVFCAATSKHYDFWLPKQMKVEQAGKKIAAEIAVYEKNNALFRSDSVFLYNVSYKKIANLAVTLAEADIKSGDTLLIM